MFWATEPEVKIIRRGKWFRVKYRKRGQKFWRNHLMWYRVHKGPYETASLADAEKEASLVLSQLIVEDEYSADRWTTIKHLTASERRAGF